MPRVGLQCVNVAFPGHTHIIFYTCIPSLVKALTCDINTFCTNIVAYAYLRSLNVTDCDCGYSLKTKSCADPEGVCGTGGTDPPPPENSQSSRVS